MEKERPFTIVLLTWLGMGMGMERPCAEDDWQKERGGSDLIRQDPPIRAERSSGTRIIVNPPERNIALPNNKKIPPECSRREATDEGEMIQ